MPDEKKVPITFDKNEDITAVFPLEDLVKEYNHINLTKPYYDRFPPLSHLPLEKNQTMVCAMKPKEAETMRISAYQPDDITILKKVFHDQFMTPTDSLVILLIWPQVSRSLIW